MIYYKLEYTQAMPPKPKDPLTKPKDLLIKPKDPFTKPKDLFTVALERFKDNLTGAEISQFNFTTLDDVWAELMKIQSEQGARRSLQNLARIEPFINGLKKYSAVIEIFVQARPEFMAFIWVVQLID